MAAPAPEGQDDNWGVGVGVAINVGDVDTLAVVAYQLARDERLGEAALPSLALVLVGLGPVLLLSRTLRRQGD